MTRCQGKFRQKRFFAEREGGQSPEQASQGSVQCQSLSEFKESLGDALSHVVWCWVVLQESGSWTQWSHEYLPACDIQGFYDSVKYEELLILPLKQKEVW